MDIIYSQLPNSAVPDNPQRGFYRWRKQEFAPVSTSVDYNRFEWNKLEDSTGIHLKPLLDFVAQAKANGRKAAFRIQTVVSGVGRICPAGIPGETCISTDREINGTFIPDWNSPIFLERIRRLFAVIGTQLNGSPDIAWIDIGVYGNWGEWHLYNLCGTRATSATLKAIVDMHVASLSEHQLVMMTDNEEAFLYAMSLKPKFPIGVRRDSWGKPKFDSIFSKPAMVEVLKERWKIAPFIVECWAPIDFALARRQIIDHHVSQIGNGNMLVSWSSLTPNQQQLWMEFHRLAGYNYHLLDLVIKPAERSIQTTWANSGNSPTHEAWQVRYIIEREDASVLIINSTIDLRKVINNVTYSEPLLLSIPLERVKVYVDIVSISDPKQKLKLATPNDPFLGLFDLRPEWSQELEEMRVKLANAQSTITGLQSTIETMQSRIDSISIELHNTTIERDKIANEMAMLESEIQVLEANKLFLEEKIQSIKTQVLTLGNNI